MPLRWNSRNYYGLMCQSNYIKKGSRKQMWKEMQKFVQAVREIFPLFLNRINNNPVLSKILQQKEQQGNQKLKFTFLKWYLSATSVLMFDIRSKVPFFKCFYPCSIINVKIFTHFFLKCSSLCSLPHLGKILLWTLSILEDTSDQC